MITKLLEFPNRLTDAITMYRQMLYFLVVLWVFAFTLSFLNLLPFSPIEFFLSSLTLLLTCYISNKLLSRFTRVPANLESVYISSLILFFIIPPAREYSEYFFLILAGLLAMGSKYVLAINKKHIFNPVAFAVLTTSLFSLGYATWWIGNQWTAVLILVGGLLIIKKIQRFEMVLGFILSFFLATFFFSFSNQSDLVKTLESIILDSPILFFSFVMLVEPLTSPTTRNMKIIYGLFVGGLAGSQYIIGPIYSTYETALIAGNIFSFFVGFKYRLVFELNSVKKLSPTIYEFAFLPNRKFNFSAGQYLEWTLGQNRPDSRGVRRYFTIASSPTEKNVRLGIRIDQNQSSTFKKTMLRLNPGDKIFAGQLSGDFVLPKDVSRKLVFVAGGIGITPFRSIIKSIIDKKENRDVVLFYLSSDTVDFVYKNIFDSAEQNGIKTVYVCSKPPTGWKGRGGRINEEMLKEEVPDYKERTYYLSGPNAMVRGNKKLLRELGIKPHKIVTDYFPGY